MKRLNILVLGVVGTSLIFAADNGSGNGQVNMVVTAEAVHGKAIPSLTTSDFVVHQGHDRLPASNAIALQGDRAGLELYLLIDDSSNTTLGTELKEIREFVAAQPRTTAVGIGYMRNGAVSVQQNPTTDHTVAGKALRLPLGNPGVVGSPFLALSDLIKRWPASAERHEVVMISSGADPLGGTIVNPYLDSAIEQAQRSGVIVYAIYTPSAGHYGHSFYRMNWGQNHLAQLAEETGGEAYFLGFGTPVTFGPYFAEITERLAHQYLVSFVPKAWPKPGLASVKLSTEVPNVDLVSASKVFVPVK